MAASFFVEKLSQIRQKDVYFDKGLGTLLLYKFLEINTKEEFL